MNTPTPTRSAAFAEKVREEPEVGRKRAKRAERTAPAAGNSYASRLLWALQGRPIFTGIDPEEDAAAANRLAKRRRKNRLAKASRKANRR